MRNEKIGLISGLYILSYIHREYNCSIVGGDCVGGFTVHLDIDDIMNKCEILHFISLQCQGQIREINEFKEFLKHQIFVSNTNDIIDAYAAKELIYKFNNMEYLELLKRKYIMEFKRVNRYMLESEIYNRSKNNQDIHTVAEEYADRCVRYQCRY